MRLKPKRLLGAILAIGTFLGLHSRSAARTEPRFRSQDVAAVGSTSSAQPPGDPVLLLVGRAPELLPGDAVVRQILEALGYRVVVRVGQTFRTAEVVKTAVVVVSSSAGRSIDPALRSATVPVIALGAPQFPLLAMTRGEAGFSFGTGDLTSRIDVVDPSHAISAGYSGPLTTTLEDAPVAWGRPESGAAVVATPLEQPDVATVFVYERAVPLVDGLPAPARRVGFFLSQRAATVLTPEGRAVFEAAVNWATGRNAPPRVDAGPDWAGTVDIPMPIQGKVFDDGLPDHSSLYVHWTAAGPATVELDDPNSERTSATFHTPGSYTLQLTGSDGEASAADTINVTVVDKRTSKSGSTAEVAYGAAGPKGSPAAIAGKIKPVIQMLVAGNEGVTWMNAVGVTTGPGSLTKTTANGWDAGAVSTKSIVAGDGYVEFTAGETNRYRMVGLSNGDLSQSYEDIEHAIYIHDTGFNVYESGVDRGYFGTYVTGNVFRVSIEGGSIKYRYNGSVFYTSTVAPRYPLVVDTSLYNPGATVQGVVLSGDLAPTAFVKQTVGWTNTVGVNATAGSLTKTAPSNWDAGAVSTQSIISGDGYVQFTVGETNKDRMIGLGTGDLSQHFSDIEYAIYLPSNAPAEVYESGISKGSFGAYAGGDVFRVEVDRGAIKYRKNGALLYTSAIAPRYPLLVDTSLFTTGATVQSVVVAGDLVASGLSTASVTWANTVGVTATTGSLTKTTASAWDSGAVSIQALVASDGYVQFTAQETTTWRMLGLGNGDADQSVLDIAYAIELGGTGMVAIWESGTHRGYFGTYVTGDVFRVAIEGGSVKYRKNGSLLYSSSVTPHYPLLVDTSLFSTGATVQAVVISGVLGENVAWRHIVGLSAQLGQLKKIDVEGWNAGAVSTRWLTAGDGFVEFSPSDAGTLKIVGLGTDDADQSNDDPEFGLEINGQGAVAVRESGADRGATGTSVVGDRLRVSVESGTVRYRRNGVLLYESTVPPSYPLLVDTAFLSNGGAVNEVLVGVGTGGTFADVTLPPPPPPVNRPPVVNAGSDQLIDLATSVPLAASVMDDGLPVPPNAMTYAWSKVSGPGTVTFGQGTSLTTTATFSLIGTYVLRLTANDSALAGYDDLIVIVNAKALLVVGDTNLSPGDEIMRGRIEALGFPVQVKAASSSVSGDANGKAVVVLSPSSLNGDLLDKFAFVTVPVITMSTGIFDDMYLVDAAGRGTDVANQLTVTTPSHPMAAGLLGTVKVLSTVPGSFAWGTPSASGVKVATIPSNSSHAAVFGYAQGAAMVGLSAPARRVGLGFGGDMPNLTQEGKRLFDAAILWAAGGNATPWADAGSDVTVVGTPGAIVTLNGRAFDDGLPNPPGAVTASWTQVSGPGTVTFGNAAQAVTSATLPALGDYVLWLTASDGAAVRSDVVVVSVVSAGTNTPPTVSAGPDRVAQLSLGVTLSATAGDDGLPNPPGALSYSWTMVGGPGAASFSAPSSSATSASFSAPGTYVLRVNVTDGGLSASDEVQVTVEQATALLVVGTLVGGSSNDNAARIQMEAAGFTVVMKESSNVTTADAVGKAVVVLNRTVNATAIGKMFTYSTTPVISLSSSLFDDLGMTGTASTEFGEVNASQLTVLDGSSPLAAGLTGTRTVYSATPFLAWGRPGANAYIVASLPTDSTKVTLFAYEKGANLVSFGRANARRLAFGMTEALYLTADGVSLFRAGLNWATQRPVPALLVTASRTMSSGEAWLRERLLGRGFTVSARSASSLSAADAFGHAVVVIAKGATATSPPAGLICPDVPIAPSTAFNVTVTTGSSSLDWLAVYQPSSGDDQWLGNSAYVALPRPKTVSLTSPFNVGTYEVRLFANNGFSMITSCLIRVKPTFSVGSPTVTEGNSGTVTASFPVTLTRGDSAAVASVNYATANSSASAGVDYAPVAGTLTFAPGETDKVVTVTVYGDTAIEPNETFLMNLWSPTGGARIVQGQGIGSITNDDGPPPPAPPVGGGPIACPTSVASGGTLQVNVSAGSSSLDWVAVYTPGSANSPRPSGFSYVALPRPRVVTLTAPSTAGNYEVRLFANDGFTLIASCALPVGGAALSVGNATVTEGATGTINAAFTVTRSGVTSSTVTLAYATADNDASAASDYTTTVGSLTFNPSEVSKVINVPVRGDTTQELNEAFYLNLSSPSAGASLGIGSQGVGLILNDDTTTLFRDAPVPVVIAEPTIFGSYGLTGSVSGTDYGTLAGQTQVSILAPTHPLARGFAGLQSVVTTADAFNWGLPAATAVSVASLAGDASKITIFGYEAGKTMVGVTAPDRRVGTFPGANAPAAFTNNGGLLFDAALLWASASDTDGDGVSTFDEYRSGTDPTSRDTNGDGVNDGTAFASGLSATNSDMDGDGLSNVEEALRGTDPFNRDTDGDGVPDGTDCFSLDVTRWQCPPPQPGDTTPPIITVSEPTNTVLIGSIPPS